MTDDDPEKRIRELEQGVSISKSQGAYPPPPPVDWQQSAPMAPAAPKKSKTPLIVGLIAVGVLVVIGALVAFVVASRPSAPVATTKPDIPAARTTTTTTTSAAPKVAVNLLTVDGMNGLLASIRAEFGDTMAYELSVHSDLANVRRVSPKDDRLMQMWLYRDGEWKLQLDSVPRRPDTRPIDVSQFDIPAVIARMESAPAELTIPEFKDRYLIVQDIQDDGIDLTIHVNGPPSGHMIIRPDGTVERLYLPS